MVKTKRTKLMSSAGSELRTDARGELLLEDRFSHLPEEILVYILSLLTLKEAARTSILSKRWKNPWKYIAKLEFDVAEEILVKVETRPHNRFLKVERRRFAGWVNRVLALHKGSTLDEFRIAFDFSPTSRFYKKMITQWLEYAFAKSVKRLVIDLSKNGFSVGDSRSYTFPYGILDLTKFVNLKSLRALYLKSVKISGEVVEFLVHNCPLEHLAIHGSADLIHLQVSGPSLRLRHLEIWWCNTKRIIISDTNLVSLVVNRAHVVLIKNTPKLVEVSIGGKFDFSWLSCLSSQLEVLTLNAVPDLPELNELPQFIRLKNLILEDDGNIDRSLLKYIPLISASPNLEKFMLKIDCDQPVKEERMIEMVQSSHPLRRLKEVEILGYIDRTCEVELINYFLGNAIALERIVIDPCLPNSLVLSPYRIMTHSFEAERSARRLAEEQRLQLIIPSHVELVIL